VSAWAAILAAARAERTVFDRARAEPGALQAALLQRLLMANAETAFGREHRFGTIATTDDFRARVPIRRYDEWQPRLDRVVAGEPSVLTREPVIAFEETSGTRCGRKLVPYTASSLLAFRAAVLPWLADLADRRPAAFAGRGYVAVSPVARAPRSIGGIPVGVASEGAYLGNNLAASFLEALAVPPSVAALTDVEQWRFVTLAHLLAARDLSIISVWSPTFMIALLEALPGLAELLLQGLRDGTAGVVADRDRMREVTAALSQTPVDTGRLWPQLDTVSAWADGVSRPYARRLAQMLPHAWLQPKGLLATESAITTPYSVSSSPVPALTSAFLEFVDEGGVPHLCEDVQAGERYRIIVTTPGGFYRYDLGDWVRCQGIDGRLPLLEFIGRDVVSDLVGEKLCEDFIGETLRSIDGPACLAPRAAATPFYELLVDVELGDNRQRLAALVDDRLCANPHYAYARRLGQLGPVVLRPLDRLLERHTRAQALRGRRLADIKPPALIDDADLYFALTNQVDKGNSDLGALPVLA
jgi:hypothetical protein